MTPATAPAVDFSRSIPPVVPEVDRALRRGLQDLVSTNSDLGLVLRDAAAGGSPSDREAGARLLADRWGTAPDPARILVANGTQNLVALLLAELVGRGGVLACERLTYSVLGTLARRQGVRLAGLAIDQHGIRPDAFEAACRTNPPRAVFCNPTVHNPTTAVMPHERRLQIGQIARHHGVAIIEDDVLGLLHPEAPPPVAALAPDVTWYVMGLTKCLAHGMRVAYLVAPDAVAAATLTAPVRQLSTGSPAPLSMALINRWTADGTAPWIARAIRAEAEARQAIGADLLAGADVATQPGALHVWLHMPPAWSARDFAAAIERRGVLVRTADLFSVDGFDTPQAVRLSLASPVARRDVERGLRVVTELLSVERPAEAGMR